MGIKFGSWAPNRHYNNTGGFKFGSSVKDRHTSICKYEILADFNLVVAKQTAKLNSPPNFLAIQYAIILERFQSLTSVELTFHFYLHSVVNYQLLFSLLACELEKLLSEHPGMSGLQQDMTYMYIYQ